MNHYFFLLTSVCVYKCLSGTPVMLSVEIDKRIADTFLEKLRFRTIDYMTMSISGDKVVLQETKNIEKDEKITDPEVKWNFFKQHCFKKKPIFSSYFFEYQIDDMTKRAGIIFIHWVPNTSSINERIKSLYMKDEVKKALNGRFSLEFQFSSMNQASFEKVKEQLLRIYA